MGYTKHNKEEHDKFRKLINEVKDNNGAVRKNCFHDLYVHLAGHHGAEDEIIFPYVLDKVEKNDKDLVFEMQEEHSAAMHQFGIVEETSLNNETWNAKFTVLEEQLTHHMDEEEDDFISLAKKVLTKEEDEELLEKWEARMKEIEEDWKERLKNTK